MGPVAWGDDFNHRVHSSSVTSVTSVVKKVPLPRLTSNFQPPTSNLAPTRLRKFPTGAWGKSLAKLGKFLLQKTPIPFVECRGGLMVPYPHFALWQGGGYLTLTGFAPLAFCVPNAFCLKFSPPVFRKPFTNNSAAGGFLRSSCDSSELSHISLTYRRGGDKVRCGNNC